MSKKKQTREHPKGSLHSSQRSKKLADDEDNIQSLCEQAETYRIKGQYAKAKPLFLRALSLAEQRFGPDDLELSSILNNLAVLYKYQGNFDEAEQLYRRALAIVEKELGCDHPDVATIYHNLGGWSIPENVTPLVNLMHVNQ